MIATWRLVARNPRRDGDLGAHTGVASHARWGARLHDVSTITREQLLAFMREELYAVQASVSASRTPQAAIVGVIESDRFEVFFDTLGTSRKEDNLRHNPAEITRHLATFHYLSRDMRRTGEMLRRSA